MFVFKQGWVFSLVCLSVETKCVLNYSSELNNYYIIEVFELFYA